MERLADDPSPESPRTRLLTVVGLVLALLLTMPFSWVGTYAATLIEGGDGPIYVNCAESLLAGDGYSYMGEAFHRRPPGFSVLLMPFLAAFGRDYSVLTLVVWLSGALMIVLLFLHQRPRLGTPVALCVCAVVWGNPFVQHTSNQIMSDVPGTAALLACLLLERRGRERPGWLPDVVLGVAIAAAAYMRAANLLLLPALFLARSAVFLRRPPAAEGAGSWRAYPAFVLRRVAPVALVVAALMAPWQVRANGIVTDEPVDLALFHSYSVALLHTDQADPGSPRVGVADLAERVEARSPQLFGSLGSRLVRRGSDWFGHFVIAGLFVLAGAIVLWRRRDTAEWFVAGTIAVLLVYVGFMSRLILPVFVLGIGAVAQVAVWGIARVLDTRRARAITAAGLLLWAVGDTTLLVYRSREFLSQGHATFLETCRILREGFEETEVISSARAPHYALELDRRVVNHAFPMWQVGLDGTLAFLDRHDVRGLVLLTKRDHDVQLLDALDGRVEEVGTVGSFIVVRLTR